MADKDFIKCYVSFVWMLCVILLSTTIVGAYTFNNNCSSVEREALISFKQGLSDPSARLSSWVGHNCCQWHGITCNLISGKVTKIDLHNSFKSTISTSLTISASSSTISPSSLRIMIISGGYEQPWKDSEDFVQVFQKTCLRGKMSSSLLELKYLNYLDLSLNNFEGAPIPYFFGMLTSLRYLNLSFANFSGQIPVYLGNLSNLNHLDLSTWKLENFDWPNLHVENLQWISGLSSLEFLNLGGFWTTFKLSHVQKSPKFMEKYNQNRDRLSKFDKVGDLSPLDKKYTRICFLNISCDWIPPFKLKVLYLENCFIGPQFPIWLRTQTHLIEITLRNVGISGSIPYEWISNISSQVTILDLSNNLLNMRLSHIFIISDQTNFVGESQKLLNDSIPLLYPNLVYLNLRNNKLWGPIPSTINDSMPKLFELDLSKNYLINGAIPSSIKTMNHLGVLLMSDNQLSGELFDDWSRLKSMFVVDLANNNLHGKIPSTIGLSTSLNVLKLENNNLHGEIPESLQNCSLLTSIDLSGNRFLNGNLPSWIGVVVSELRLLNLRSNNFSGTIPRQWCNLLFLRIFDLSNNRLVGEVPSCLYNWTSFVEGNDDIIGLGYYHEGKKTWYYSFEEKTRLVMKGIESEYYNKVLELVLTIDLSRNELSGQIPNEITKLIHLVTLNLSWNALVGTISESIGAMKTLETLDLSHNHLSGRIPDSLTSLNFLTHLNMSFNNLTGRIPTGNQLQTLEDPWIYEGNHYLCGPPLIRIKCPGDESSSNLPISTSEGEEDGKENDSAMVGFYISMAVGFPFGISILLFTICTNEARRIFYFGIVDRVNYNILQTIAFLTIGLRRMIIWRR
ncbi:receptor-like protein EIX2 [Cucumis sativus]|uniref:receptor-like protein EIX2 n=1 Tax=Cucumis sativus TaxID=3659 RepID=UPI0012F4C15D|nr:receptor-like protein EIX2 [Cucumis sativus]